MVFLDFSYHMDSCVDLVVLVEGAFHVGTCLGAAFPAYVVADDDIVSACRYLALPLWVRGIWPDHALWALVLRGEEACSSHRPHLPIPIQNLCPSPSPSPNQNPNQSRLNQTPSRPLVAFVAAAVDPILVPCHVLEEPRAVVVAL